MEVEEYLGRSRWTGVSEAGRTDGSSSATPLVSSKRGSFGAARGIASTWVGELLGWIAGRRYKLVDFDEQLVERYRRHRGGRQSIQPVTELRSSDGCRCCARKA